MKALAIFVLYIWTAVASAQQSPAQTTEQKPDPNKVKSMTLEAGKPVEITFNDGRVIQFHVANILTSLHSTLTLSDNSCTTAFNNQTGYVIPMMLKSLIPMWKVHPTKAGEPVTSYDTEDKVDRVASDSSFRTRLNHPDKFDAEARLIPASQVEDKDALDAILANPGTFGFLRCNGDCSPLLPQSRDLIYWDENFETGSMETSLISGIEAPDLNKMSSRLQEMKLSIYGDKIMFGNPKKTFGLFALFLPPGITYQIQWYFQAPNLVQADDQLCQIRWDMDFTQVFDQFTSLGTKTENVEAVKKAAYPVYLYNEADKNDQTLSYMFSTYKWESSEYHK
jgi:methionine-rich copper-binding protein CopC